MKTSYYARVKPGKSTICISRGMPKWATYKRYFPLAPGPWFKSVSQEEYITKYFNEILSKLDPQKVWDELHELTEGEEPILLCYEAPDKFCHRRLVALWFEEYLKVQVPELSKAEDIIINLKNEKKIRS